MGSVRVRVRACENWHLQRGDKRNCEEKKGGWGLVSVTQLMLTDLFEM